MELVVKPRRETWPALLKRPVIQQQDLEGEVAPILERVRCRGDSALKELTLKFEGRVLDEPCVSAASIESVSTKAAPHLRTAIDQAAANIRRFHLAQLHNSTVVETMPGVVCWWRDLPIDRVGLYIPGGTAPLVSTMLMLGIPARLAGCREIAACTPLSIDSENSGALLYAAKVAGITELYALGGAQAIAALAYGTQSIRPVDKIFGPGNQYVTCAKVLVNRDGVAIDMPAGPSELAVIADSGAPPAWVAADLLSQAEHGFDSQVMLVTFEVDYAESVLKALSAQLTSLPRSGFAANVLGNSRAVVACDLAQAMELVNLYAPEHLVLALQDPSSAARLVRNAGSVFLGYFSPVSVGDYASGTNHVLPTNGYARTLSGIGVQSFMKRTTFQQLNRDGLRNISATVASLAAAEGLDAHKRAVTIRLEDYI